MRFMKLLLAFCLVICLSTPSFSLNPYETNAGGFGPRIAGAQLGAKMSLRDIVRWRVNLRGLPFILEINSERIPGRRPSENGSISLRFTGKDKDLSGFEIVSATRGFYRYKSENMKLPDLVSAIESDGIETITLRGTNRRIKENCITFTEDLRVASINVRKSDFGARAMSHESFLREMSKNYSLPEMRRRGNVWDYRNEREGWQVTYHALGDGILSIEPVITD